MCGPTERDFRRVIIGENKAFGRLWWLSLLVADVEGTEKVDPLLVVVVEEDEEVMAIEARLPAMAAADEVPRPELMNADDDDDDCDCDDDDDEGGFNAVAVECDSAAAAPPPALVLLDDDGVVAPALVPVLAVLLLAELLVLLVGVPWPPFATALALRRRGGDTAAVSVFFAGVMVGFTLRCCPSPAVDEPLPCGVPWPAL